METNPIDQQSRAAHEHISGSHPENFTSPTSDEDGLMPILKPLAKLLEAKCLPEDLGSIIPVGYLYGQGPWVEEPNVTYLEFAVGPELNEPLTRYLGALLRKTESENAWMDFDDYALTEHVFWHEHEYTAPIRFSIHKQVFGAVDTLIQIRYLVAECFDEDFDRAAAKRQVNLLVEFLSDERNVPEITDEKVSMLL